jgi:hypothetical protein
VIVAIHSAKPSGNQRTYGSPLKTFRFHTATSSLEPLIQIYKDKFIKIDNDGQYFGYKI